ncbi:MAG: hypothetical protein KH090_18705, partial [Bacteroides salyersiae]|nr:hypothetical protein [Bacteroides salyersiae]
ILRKDETSRQEARQNSPYRYRPDRGECRTDVSPQIYTLGMMKRQENKHRFYLWDYLHIG